jgi:hypothetical protein
MEEVMSLIGGEVIEGVSGPSPSRNLAPQTQRRAPARRAPADDAAQIMAAIVAAVERGVDVGVMERLYQMQREIVADKRKAAYAADLVEMMPAMPTVSKRGKITIKEKNSEKVIQSTPYALWEDIHTAITPILHAHGFSLTFRTSYPDNKVAVTAILLHREGHQEETTVILQHDSSGSKNNVQGVGSSTSYGKRYSGCALLNINVGGEDDDGKAAGQTESAGADDPYITEEQHEDLRKLILDSKADLNRFLDYVQAPSLSDVLKTHYPKGRAMLLQKIERNKGASQ